jgi:hypothetical protein
MLAIFLAILYALILLVLTGISLLCLEYDLHTFRNRRRGLYSFDWLSDHTGIFRRSELEALVGPRRTHDRLYEIPESLLKTLPRNRWVGGLYHPLLCAAFLPGLIACAVVSILDRQPCWTGLAWAGSYIAFSSAWDIAWAVARENTGAEESETTEGESHNTGPDAAAGDETLDGMIRDLREFQRDTEREIERQLSNGELSPLMKWCFKFWLGSVVKKARRLEIDLVELQNKADALMSSMRHGLLQMRWIKAKIQRREGPERKELESEADRLTDELERIFRNARQAMRDAGLRNV